MRIFIAGVDGYLGWALALYLAARDHVVGGADCYHRRDWVQEVGSHSAIPISRMTKRGEAYRKRFGRTLHFHRGDLTDHDFVRESLRAFRPDAVVHFGEMPSAPYSMIDARHCVFTHTNNAVGTLNIIHVLRDEFPDCHLVKLGSMGEYGTSNLDIPEGNFEVEYRGRKDVLPFPCQPGSFYHASKVADSVNIRLACKVWGLKSTDIMQGVVYGTRIDEMFRLDKDLKLEVDGAGMYADLRTRFDFDAIFGTAINRFCAQAAIGAPITPYGRGKQKRGFLPLRDSMQCITLVLEKPPNKGEYRVLNQFEEVRTIMELAQEVFEAAALRGIDAKIKRVENPRIEAEVHHYRPDRKKLLKLGYKPNGDMHGELTGIIDDLCIYDDRIRARKHLLIPDVHWSGKREPVRFVKK